MPSQFPIRRAVRVIRPPSAYSAALLATGSGRLSAGAAESVASTNYFAWPRQTASTFEIRPASGYDCLVAVNRCPPDPEDAERYCLKRMSSAEANSFKRHFGYAVDVRLPSRRSFTFCG